MSDRNASDNISVVAFMSGAPYNYRSWIFTEIVMILSIAVYIYVLFRLSKGECDRKSATRNEGSLRSLNAIGIQLQRLCIVTAILDIFYAIATQGYMVAFWRSEIACDVTVLLGATFYSTSLLGSFTFLWSRQRALNGNPLLEHLSTKINKVLSWTCIIGIYLTILVPTVTMFAWRRYETTSQGCKLKEELLPTFQKWYIAYTISYFASQLLLLWLYLHPLLKHRTNKAGKEETALKSNLTSNRIRNQRDVKLQSCIVRSMTTAAFCVTSDILSAIAVTLISKYNEHRWTMLIAHCLNLNINLLSMVGCFVHWKDLLLPCRAKRDNNVLINA